MPLTHLVSALPGIRHTAIEEVVHRPGWLLAQACKSWFGEPQSDIADLLMVYRSPLVKDTKKMYAPVLDRILRAEKLDVLYATEIEDHGMMHGIGEFTLYRFTKPGLEHIFSVQQIRNVMQQLMDDRYGTANHDGDLVI